MIFKTIFYPLGSQLGKLKIVKNLKSKYLLKNSKDCEKEGCIKILR